MISVDYMNDTPHASTKTYWEIMINQVLYDLNMYMQHTPWLLTSLCVLLGCVCSIEVGSVLAIGVDALL